MITYFFEEIEPVEIKQEIVPWLNRLITLEGYKAGKINYIFCDDQYLLKVNRDFLDHDYYTDVITFDYVKGKTVSGEIFVSLPRISENADLLKSNFLDELHRVLAHGMLHLCGYKDKTPEEQEEMTARENHYLALLSDK